MGREEGLKGRTCLPVGREKTMDINIKKEEKVPLSGLSTFKIGGDASHLFRVSGIDDLKEALAFAKVSNLPIQILGGGSNMLFHDDGFEGVIVRLESKGIREEKKSGREEEGKADEDVYIRAEAGEEWDAFVEWTVSHGYFGLENLSGIPGTVGATPIQNIGAYGVEVKDFIESVEVFDTDRDLIRTLTPLECKFGYRTSLFKGVAGKSLIVLSVTFKLSKLPNIKIGYKDLTNYFKDNTEPTPEEVREAVISIRSAKFPDLTLFGTAGSFFKNVICESGIADRLKAEYPDIPLYDAGENMKKISTAFILDKVCGLRDFRIGSVGLYTNQSLVVVNYGNASSEEVRNFVSKVKEIVKEKTGIQLEEEVVIA